LFVTHTFGILITTRSELRKVLFLALSVCGFWATVSKTVRAMLSDRCLSVLSVCDVGVLWPKGLTDQDETWRAGRPRRWPHCVRRGPSSPPQRGTTPNFRPISVAAKWLQRSRFHLVWSYVGLGPVRLCVRWGSRSPYPTMRAETPNFRPMLVVAKRLDGSRWYLVWR